MADRDQTDEDRLERLDDGERNQKNNQGDGRRHDRDEGRDARLQPRPGNDRDDPPAQRDAALPDPGFEQKDRRTASSSKGLGAGACSICPPSRVSAKPLWRIDERAPPQSSHGTPPRPIAAINPRLTIRGFGTNATHRGNNSARLTEPSLNRSRLRVSLGGVVVRSMNMHGLTSARAFKFGAALVIGLALGACAKNNADATPSMAPAPPMARRAATRISPAMSAIACSSKPIRPN